MTPFKRYAIYYAPRPGDFAAQAAAWLGWDVETGRSVPFAGPDNLPGDQAALTKAPRKYGFHGTIKAPFRLAQGLTQADLEKHMLALSAGLAPVVLDGLQLHQIKGFLALLPQGDGAGLLALGEKVVTALDPLRAALTPAEVAKRRPETLSPRQRELLDLWGYPYVMEEFRFHLTLSDDLSGKTARALAEVLAPWFQPVLPKPFVIEDLCLFGEDAAGRFHLIHRYPLTAAAPQP